LTYPLMNSEEVKEMSQIRIDDFSKEQIIDETEVISLSYKGQNFDFNDARNLAKWLALQCDVGGLFEASGIKITVEVR